MLGWRTPATLLLLALLVAPAVLSINALAKTYPEQVSGDVIKIGMTISLSGKYQHEGMQALCGIQAAIDYFNDKGGIDVGGKKYKLQLIYYDDQSKKDLINSLYTQLVTSDGAMFLLAPYSSGLTLAAAPISQQYKRIMISHGGASDKIFQQGYQYMVQILTPASKYFKTTLELIKEKDPQAKIAFIYENAAFAKAVMGGAKAYAKELGLNVVYENTYEPKSTDFSSIIAEAKSSGAEVLIGGGHYEDGFQLVKQAYELGWKLKFISILVAVTHESFYKDLGPSIAENVAGPSQWEPMASYTPEAAKKAGKEWFGPTKEEWLSYFNKHCEGTPAYQAAEAGAAIVFLVKAIQEAGSLDTDAVRQAMNNLDIMTFFGPLKIDPKTGLQVGHPMVLLQWQNGEKQIIYPESAATADPVYPAPNWWKAAEATEKTTTTTEEKTTGKPAGEATTITTSGPAEETATTEEGGNQLLIAGIIIIILIIAAAALFMRR
ncbi:MAG: amino acid ABC transporter substrate-binding protein [Desulfurococcales archaeon]|nr:amino acid ABC transporter substrate-binding protein [Desulfurococcales archaeon]